MNSHNETMKTVLTSEMRELDRKTIEDFHVPGEVLMDRAGDGVAHIVELLIDRYEGDNLSVLLIAGRGNNGGDAFVAARYLNERGYDANVWIAGKASDITGDARIHLDKMNAAGISLKELSAIEDWQYLIKQHGGMNSTSACIIVDALLGTGIKGAARGAVAEAIRFINMMSRENQVVSIDVPSGLNSDTGQAEGDAVSADVTLTMGLPKRGLVQPCAANFVGRIEVMDIGIPHALVSEIESDVELITPIDLCRFIPRRPRDAHKGNYGHVLMFGGAAGYAGAITMAARAAVRSGAGLVTVVVPRDIAPVVAGAVPEAMVHGVSETETSSLSSDCWSVWSERLNDFTAVLCGPGMTRHNETEKLVRQILDKSTVPLVMDADALNVFEGNLDDLGSNERRACPLVVTPHPGEMGRLMSSPTSKIQADRFASAKECASRTHAVVVLKGVGTLVVEGGKPLNVNMTGNPGMATGGTGDVLSGLLAGLLAQGLKPFDAARAAVYIHGKAGDMAASEKTEYSMTACDVIESIPYAFKNVLPRQMAL